MIILLLGRSTTGGTTFCLGGRGGEARSEVESGNESNIQMGSRTEEPRDGCGRDESIRARLS